MKNDLISIIIPVYNVEKYVRQCLDSVINQTYKNLEIIIVDDGSTDDSGLICEEFAKKDKRIRLIHQENADLSAARNTGLKMATGKYIGYVDSDDYLELNMYEKLHKLMVKEKCDIAICNRFIGLENGKQIKNKKFPNKKMLTGNESLALFYKNMYVRNKLYKKDFIKNLLFIETFAQDTLYNFALFKKTDKIVCINEHLIHYRYNPKSRQHTKKFKKNRIIFIEKGLNEEIAYAEKYSLNSLKNNLIDARTGFIIRWIGFLALEKSQDIGSVHYFQDLLRKNLSKILKSKRSIVKKCFILLVCINFKLASFIYRFINKIKGVLTKYSKL